MMPSRAVEGRIRLSAVFVLLGLAVEAVTLSILHPLSFIVFASVGVALIAIGIVVFLFTLLQAGDAGPT